MFSQVKSILPNYTDIFELVFLKAHFGIAVHQLIPDDTEEYISYKFILVNPAFEKMTHKSNQEVFNKDVKDVFPGIEDYWFTSYRDAVKTSTVIEFINFCEPLNSYFHCRCYPIDIDKFVVIFEDVTEQTNISEKIKNSEIIFRYILDGIVITNAKCLIIYTNPAFTNITGYTAAEALGKNPKIVKSGVHSLDFYKTNFWKKLTELGQWQGDLINRKKTGELYHQRTTINVIRNSNNDIIYYISVFSDITIIKQAEKQIFELAYKDSVTGLDNKNMLYKDINYHIENKDEFYLVFINIKGFKTITNQYGFNFGNSILNDIGKKILFIIKYTKEKVYKLNNDEFAIMSFRKYKSLLGLLNKLKTFRCKVEYQHMDTITVTDYIGISHYPSHGNTAEELIKAVDLAMLSSKRNDSNQYTFFTFNLQYDFNRKLLLEEQLKRAVENDEIEINYQPQYHLIEYKLIGAEVLIRWNSSKLGYMYPDSFINIAEDNYTIIPITYWIFESVCQFIQKHKLQFKQFPRIAINFSPKQLDRVDLIEHLRKIISKYPLVSFSDIEIEITESVMLCKSKTSYTNLIVLKEEGSEISMDDFGTGYSTLDYLVKLPITKIKIDKSFVLNLFAHNNNYIIVKSIISLANNLNIKVIAEGVETEEQKQALIAEGCYLGQGYLFSKPISKQQFLTLLEEYA